MQISFVSISTTIPPSPPRLNRVYRNLQLPHQVHNRSRSQPTMTLPVLVRTALSTAIYQASFFTVSYIKKFDILYDFAGTTNFTLIALQSFLTSPGNIRNKAVTSFVVTWATRLGGFLLHRILKWGHDKRFDSARNNFNKLALFWSIQAVWVWVTSLPVTLLNASPHASGLGTVDYIGWALFLCGFATEAVADLQKSRHKLKSDKWVNTGLWKLSRHPNYFGEILVWFGIYLSSVSGLRGFEHAAVISPVFITSLLLFVSGVPLLEHSADRKHGENPEYVEYKRNTSVVIPCPAGLYRRLPVIVRGTLFLEFGIYDNLGKGKEG